MEHEKLMGVLKRVREARRAIESGSYDEDFITQLCSKLGFNDTSFREKSAQAKLKDFLLDENYWLERAEIVRSPCEHWK